MRFWTPKLGADNLIYVPPMAPVDVTMHWLKNREGRHLMVFCRRDVGQDCPACREASFRALVGSEPLEGLKAMRKTAIPVISLAEPDAIRIYLAPPHVAERIDTGFGGFVEITVHGHGISDRRYGVHFVQMSLITERLMASLSRYAEKDYTGVQYPSYDEVRIFLWPVLYEATFPYSPSPFSDEEYFTAIPFDQGVGSA